MSAFTGQQFTDLQLQNLYRSAAAQAQQEAQKASAGLASSYNQLNQAGAPAPSAPNPVTYSSSQPDQADQMQQVPSSDAAVPEPLGNGAVLVTKPTVALLGDKGAESVIPLNSSPYNKTSLRYRGGQCGG